jgi:hypothetical protein
MQTTRIDVNRFRSDAMTRVDLVGELYASSSIQLNKLIDGLILNAPDSLFEAMTCIEDSQTLTSHFNVMRQLKIMKKSLGSEFNTLLSDAWSQLLIDQGPLQPEKANRKAEKVLFFFSHRVRNQFKPLLTDLESNIATLVEVECVIHPLSPEFLYLAFWQSTGMLDLAISERLLIIPLFSRFVTDQIGLVLASANDLINARVNLESA